MKQYSIILLLLTLASIGCKDSPSPAVNTAQMTSLETRSKPQTVQVDIIYGVDYIMGKFNPAKHNDFTEISLDYADRSGRYMHSDAMAAFKDMHAAAKSAGIVLVIKSAARNFDYQKGIWERKWTGSTTLSDGTNAANDIKSPIHRARKILQYSSMPGTSRHHWGTDIDINSFDNSYFTSGKGLAEYKWLLAHAEDYGFVQVYTAFSSERPKGYNEEKWHWSYRPISRQLSLEAKQLLKDSMIKGFKGDMTPQEIEIVKHYVLGINPKCLDKPTEEKK